MTGSGQGDLKGVGAGKERNLIAVIGDEDTVTGILLAGVGHIDNKKRENFLVVDQKTSIQTIQAFFHELCTRRDIGIILISQHVANEIRDAIEEQQSDVFPVVLEIPSKDHPYDPEQDSIMKRIRVLFGKD